MLKITSFFIATALCTGFALAQPGAGAPASVAIEGAWVRAMPPGQSVTAAYLRAINRGTVGLKITGASSDVADRVEMHRTQEVDGRVRMQRLDHVLLPAGGEAQFAPGGAHLMLLGLPRMPETGESVHLCLQLDIGETVCTEATVRRATPAPGGHSHH